VEVCEWIGFASIAVIHRTTTEGMRMGWTYLLRKINTVIMVDWRGESVNANAKRKIELFNWIAEK
jgi:hypothetical protein